MLFDVADDGIATLTLNETSQMNPISAGTLQGCLRAIERVRDDTSVRPRRPVLSCPPWFWRPFPV